ncbi:Beta-ketoacyl synthase, N-terminal domain [Pseudomonas cannabina]|nr:Beta-ketoacyl synthase, N-terminal domain [Pseudomonas cannabina]
MKKQREWPITTLRRSILGNTYDNRELNVKQHVSGRHTQNRQRSSKTDLIKALLCNRFSSRDPIRIMRALGQIPHPGSHRPDNDVARNRPAGAGRENLITFNIARWHAWAPGLASVDDWRQWSHHPTLLETGDEAPDVSFLPAMQRRRLGRMARMAFAVGWPLKSRFHQPSSVCQCITRWVESSSATRSSRSLSCDATRPVLTLKCIV